MKKYHVFLTLLVFLCHSKAALSFLPLSYPLHERIEKSDIVGVVKVVGVRRGQPPLLEAELHKLYKGDYISQNGNATRRIFVDLTGVTSRFNLIEPSGSGLVKYRRDPMHLVFLKQASIGFLEGQRVMTPVNWTFETMLPIRNNLISNIAQSDQFRSTHDYLSAIERIVEIDALPDREQKITLLKELQSVASTKDNPHLFSTVQSWLLAIEQKMEREKTSANTLKSE